jgi:hypothetical protein
LANVVTSPTDDGKRALCDSSIGCVTNHDVTDDAGAGTDAGATGSGGGTALTGSDITLELTLGAILLGVGGLLMLATLRRRTRRNVD